MFFFHYSLFAEQRMEECRFLHEQNRVCSQRSVVSNLVYAISMWYTENTILFHCSILCCLPSNCRVLPYQLFKVILKL